MPNPQNWSIPICSLYPLSQWETSLLAAGGDNKSLSSLVLGTKPKNLNESVGIPDNCKEQITDDGPGIENTPIPFSIKYFTSLKPGSDIRGEPASEIKAKIWFFAFRQW